MGFFGDAGTPLTPPHRILATPRTRPVLLVAAGPLVPPEDAGVVGAEQLGVVAAHLAQGGQPLVQLVDALPQGTGWRWGVPAG